VRIGGGQRTAESCRDSAVTDNQTRSPPRDGLDASRVVSFVALGQGERGEAC
jgi:hypothetical protein